jgi:HAD superfamily hydrolase (TIGR01549 family)
MLPGAGAGLRSTALSAQPARTTRLTRQPLHPLLADRARLSGCLIDMGGVLVDEHRTWRRWQTIALAELRASGVDVDRTAFVRALRQGIAERRPRITRAVLIEMGGDEALAARVRARVANQDHPLTDAAAGLARLAARVPLVLVANQELHARALLERVGLDRHFQALLLSAEIGVSKPDPAIFERGLAALGADASRVAMVGDRLDFDVGPARQLGLLAVRIRRGPFCWQCPLDAAERPHRTFPNLLAAARWLAP